jgi:hypothetical protein
LAGKIHLTSLYLPDILLSLLALSIELSGVAVLPVHRPFPTFPSLLRAAVWTRWMRRSSSAGLQLAVASHAFLVELRCRALCLAVGEFLVVTRVEDDDSYRFV